jgi:hypothetical protein
MRTKIGIAAVLAALLLPSASWAAVDDDEFSSAVAPDDFTLLPEPEPETLVLCAAGILGLLVAGSGGRRRKDS